MSTISAATQQPGPAAASPAPGELPPDAGGQRSVLAGEQPRATARGQVLAPSSPMAKAARAFGDEYPPIDRHWPVRAAGLAYLIATLIYVPWLLGALNHHLPWLSWPFFAANLLTLATTFLSIFNHWWRSVPPQHPLPRGVEPSVGVLVPCCGEPVPMILRTIASVLEQDWPHERLVIVVSDDARDPALERALEDWPVLYHVPPPRYAPGRDGAAKSGNLNSAFVMLVLAHPEVRYVETRDCDDELGSNGFLRQAVGQLERDERLAYVQTIKEAQVSAGDPFNNREAMFYRGQMLSRNASNATFPCGSGLVWRRAALEHIGLFPTWNLVEDLQSGVEALRRGWRGCYLPIVGAVGQHSPEDVPNVYKQRGTWAIDTVRLMLWGDLSGLSVRQRAQFYELLFYYVHAFTMLVYVPCVMTALLGYVPFKTNVHGFVLHLLPLVLATEAWLLAINRPYNDRRRRQRHPIRELWRVRIIWSGLAPVFMKATIQAIVGGPARKPIYKVTRKHNDARWHWSSILPHGVVLAMVTLTLMFALRRGTLPPAIVLVPFLYWGGMYVVLLAGFVARSWHGVYNLGQTLRPTVERRTAEPAKPALTAAAEPTVAESGTVAPADTREALNERLEEVLRWREAHERHARLRLRRPGGSLRLPAASR